MSRRKTFIKGTIILTLSGVIIKGMGFLNRIFLSRIYGEEGMGIYQLIFPVLALGVSFSSSGIQLAVSRCVSKYQTLKQTEKLQKILISGLVLSLSFSVSMSLFLYLFADIISSKWLHNASVKELLEILAFIFPFSSIHNCISGYYYGLKQTKIPAVSNIIEQTVRIISMVIFYTICKSFCLEFKLRSAVFTLILGEIAACIYSTRKIYFTKTHLKQLCAHHKEILFLSLPVSFNRIFINLLQSIEAISIPKSLLIYGLNEKDALSTYGVLTGMALPCILFPAALTNAASTLLLPTVSEIHTINNQKSLSKLILNTLKVCSLFGALCCIFFQLTGNVAGTLLFKSELAGQYIITLSWICPFMYTNNTLLSIINGLGKTHITFTINAFHLSARIVAVLFLIPKLGIYGYLISLLLCQIFVLFFTIMYLHQYFKAEA